MVGGWVLLDSLPSECASHASRAHVFLFGLICVYCAASCTHVQASNAGTCASQNILSKLEHCETHPDGVHGLYCFVKHTRGQVGTCVWKSGKGASEKTYTLVIKQRGKTTLCYAYDNITEFSENIKLFERMDMDAEVYENSPKSTNCTKARFKASPKRFLRCGPPHEVSFRRHDGRLLVNVRWPQEDVRLVKAFRVSYKALGSPLSSKSVESRNATTCTVDHLNASLVYTAQIHCVTNDKCPQCAESDAYTVPPELTTQPLIVDFKETDLRRRKGCRLLLLTWKFPANEPHDGYHVGVGKASGEAPWERIVTTRPEIRLVLSYSAYHLEIRAVNNASASPAVSWAIPQREETPRTGAGQLNVTVHSNTSFTVYWKDDLIRNYVCYSVEWSRKGRPVAYMSFYQGSHNYRNLSLVRESLEPLEPYQRYSLTLHTRPDKDTCNMKSVNNSERTYGRTQFYFTEGSPVSAPTNISSYNVTLHSVVLQWASIPEEDVRGFLLGYTIHYNEYHHGRSSTPTNVTVDPMRNSHELEGLRGGTAYEVQISGFTRAGAGVRSAASLFKTSDQGFSNLGGIFIISAFVATVLIFGPPVMKRAKVILWPSIPNPRKSNAMQTITEPWALELLEPINTLRAEEWDTSSLQVVEKEDAAPARTSPSMLQLLRPPEDEDDSPGATRDWIRRDGEEATGGVPAYSTEETFLDSQQTDAQSVPLAFSGDYTTLDMFQQGAPPGTPVATGSKPEEPGPPAVKSSLDYIRQFSTSSVSDGKTSTTL